MLVWLVNEREIEPHIPVFDKSARDDGTFSREDFASNQETDTYVCPAAGADLYGGQHCSILANVTATLASSSRVAVRGCPPARSRVEFARKHEM